MYLYSVMFLESASFPLKMNFNSKSWAEKKKLNSYLLLKIFINKNREVFFTGNIWRMLCRRCPCYWECLVAQSFLKVTDVCTTVDAYTILETAASVWFNKAGGHSFKFFLPLNVNLWEKFLEDNAFSNSYF